MEPPQEATIFSALPSLSYKPGRLSGSALSFAVVTMATVAVCRAPFSPGFSGVLYPGRPLGFHDGHLPAALGSLSHTAAPSPLDNILSVGIKPWS